MFFSEFPKNFQNSCVKEQLYVVCSCSGYSRRNGWVLKDLIRSALSLVIHKICKFKTFLLLLRCSVWSSDTKNIQNCITVIFHLMCLTNHLSSQRVITLVHIFFFITDVKLQRCVCVCVCVCVVVSLMLKINSTTDNGFLFLPF